MNKEFVEKEKQKLLELRERTVATLQRRSTEASNLAGSGESGDEVDRASDRIDGTLLNQLIEKDTETLEMIDAALDRIDQDEYGVCLLCGTEIPEARLEVTPYAALCIDCESKQELRTR